MSNNETQVLKVGSKIRITRLLSLDHDYGIRTGDELTVLSIDYDGDVQCSVTGCSNRLFVKSQFELVPDAAVDAEPTVAKAKRAKPYKALCKRVKAIDAEAYKYMRGEAKALSSYSKTAVLLCAAFNWNSTPQGHGYWHNISKQLGE